MTLSFVDYHKLKKDMLEIFKNYEDGTLELEDVGWEFSELEDEYFPGESEEYPELNNKKSIKYLYFKILFCLKVFPGLFPKDLKIAKKILETSTEENLKDCFKKWDKHWKKMDKERLSRREEGVKRGYWEDHSV